MTTKIINIEAYIPLKIKAIREELEKKRIEFEIVKREMSQLEGALNELLNIQVGIQMAKSEPDEQE